MKAVKFLMAYTVGTLYAKGETASFHDPVADDLVERKIAEPVAMKKGSKKKDDPPADPARAELEKLNVPDLDKIIEDEKIEGVASDANKAAKIDAIVAARAAA